MKNLKMIGLFILILTMPIIINVFMSISTQWVKGDVGDWISFYGSYLGAILGALVAFQVAKMQIKSQNDINKMENITNQLPYLVMIKIEIEKVVDFINKLSDMDKSEILLGKIEYINFQNPKEINEENWIGIEKIYDKNLIVSLVNFKERYKQLCVTLKINLEENESEFNNLVLKINKLKGKSNRNSKEENDFHSFNVKYNALLAMIEMAKYNKKSEWESIKAGTLIALANSILKTINENINNIDAILANK